MLFYNFFSTFVFMRKKLFDDLPKSLKLASGTWLHIFPDSGEGYRLYDPLEGKEMGRILFDEGDNWIYDGDQLCLQEQEDAAGAITGYQKEMDELFNTLKRY
jgi:hypothetical protein